MRKIFISLFTSGVFGAAVSFFVVFILQYFHFGNNFEQVSVFIKENTKLSMLGILLVFIIFTWLGLIFRSSVIAGFLLIVFASVAGFASSQKQQLRGEPLYPSDIVFLKDATFFLDVVDKRLLLILIFVLLFTIVSIGFYLFKRKRSSTPRPLLRFVGILGTSLLLFQVYNFNQPGNKVKAIFNNYVSWISYSQSDNYTKNGVVAGLLYNLKAPALDKPLGYSQERIEEIYNKYSKEADLVNENRVGLLEDVNIIYIMNETFADIHRLEGITIDGGDSLELYRDLPGQHGYALSQVYGGGTANVEFEALTGIPQEPLNGNISIPYIHLSQQIGQLPSITDFLIESHQLTAIHPHNSTMYKRYDNYNAMGFDELIFKDDMSYSETIDRSPYISDQSSYDELMGVMTESEKRDFIHLVTMQNHMAYTDKYDNVQFQVDGTEDNEEVRHYLKGMSYSDIAVADLIDKLENFDEKVLLIFWGDHLPSLFNEDVKALNGYRSMHETPLLIYSNFSEISDNLGTISPFYFINNVLRITDTKITPYVALLQRLEKALPAFEKNFYLERETGIKNTRKELKQSTQVLLNELDLILYDITTGKNHSKKLGFY
ncbi:LTA synthase family protein [Jeotgalibaca sp. A122]|uniref:LTA synthase family protein n=1 Tax=Jeotgalibaca sp. A122 TaxID=3457322 RepID=UPI003FD5DD41